MDRQAVRLLVVTATGAALCGLPAFVAADAGLEAVELPLWELGVGAGGNYGAAYPASDEERFKGLPFPVVIYRGDLLRIGGDDLVAGRLFRNRRFELDVSAGGSFNTDSEDVEIREGMPDLDYLFELGPELEIRLDDFSDPSRKLKLELPVRAAFSSDFTNVHARGMLFAPQLELEQYAFLGTPYQVDYSITPIFASEKFHDYFYEVSPELAGPGRPAFDAGGGYLGTELGVGVRRYSGPYQFFFGGNVTAHQGAANADSPLYRRDFTFSVYAAFVRLLWSSERRAPD
ncbi:MAG TPA: MipA/OmpV family protein [Gammaproteobacteria bacterium]|nr:MipA/OmpV family protein [Gammaproteobacteria bacterium]